MEKRHANTSNTKGQRCTLDVPGLGLIDGRTREAKLYGLTVQDIISDLGGQENLSRTKHYKHHQTTASIGKVYNRLA